MYDPFAMAIESITLLSGLVCLQVFQLPFKLIHSGITFGTRL